MDSLLAFIPEDRRLALVGGNELPDRATGCVLFADISGFTPLTAALAQELGVRRGAEEVLNQINPVYEAIIAELHRYGGSVMGFAGDSITCWLDGDDGWRGVACALAMQDAMRPFATVRTPAGTPVHLAIKVAVTAGPARRFVVGDPAIQLIDVLAGRTLDHVASAEKLAEKGEVLAGEEIIRARADVIDVAEWRRSTTTERFAVIGGLRQLPEPAPYPPLPADSLPEEQMRAWALQPIYRRMSSDAAAANTFLAELRPTVALFLKFTGIDYDNDDEAGRKLDHFVRWLQATVEKQEGFLIQLTMGDKGSYAYASFGAPLAHDDDSLRAVAAALELRQPPPELDFVHDIQIGVSRGRVWAGECGARVGAGTPRFTYGVMGNEVNMAARLMGKASPGQILVRRRVAEEAKQGFQFRQLGLITVKGGAEPIPVAEVVGRQQGHSVQGTQYELPLVGREGELAQLKRLLDSTWAGRAQVVTLQGPTGIGKSHLVAVFQQFAGANGFQVITGTGQRIFQSSTYWPWQEALRQLLGLSNQEAGGEAAVAQAELAAQTLVQMNPDWSVRVPLLRDMLGLPLEDNPTTAAFDPRQRQEALFAFVVEIIRTWSRSQPLLLVFENAHWMDDSSRALLETLAKASPDGAMMIIAVVRPAAETDTQVEVLLGLRALPNHHLLPLGELAADGVGQLVGNLLGGSPSLLARLLIEAKAQGNPFFTHELVDALREANQLRQEEGEWVLSESMIDALRTANALVREDGAWVLAQAADLSTISLGIPDSIHGVILARLDRLPDSHKPTIKVASVIGYSFELGLLAQAHPARPTTTLIHTQAETLEQRDFIVHDYSLANWDRGEGMDGPDDRYTFRQQATQEVSYETLLFTQRRELHRNLAALLEQQSPDAIDQIAYHAYLGEDWGRSLRYHLLAGSKDRKLFANMQSLDHFRKALASAEQLSPDETLAQRQQINAELGELLLTIGQRDAAMEHLQAALQMAEELADDEARAHACRWLARAHEMRGEYQPALEWIDRGLAALGDRLTPSSLELRLLGGLIYSRQGEYKQASEQALASLLAAEELRLPSIVARAHSLMGTIDRLRGRLEVAVEHFEEARTIYRQLGDLQGQAVAQNSLANALFDLGRWREADHYYQEAGRIFSQLGNVYNRLLVDNNLGGIALNQGRADDALLFYRRALRSLEQIGGSLWVMGALNLNLGATHVRRGETAIAFEHLERSRELFAQARVRDLLPEMHRRLAEAHLSLGATAEARREAETSHALAKDLAMLAEVGLALRTLAVISAEERQIDEAMALLKQSIAMLSEVGDNYGLACAQLCLAELHSSRGETELAAALLEKCRPVFERLGAAHELARAQSLEPAG